LPKKTQHTHIQHTSFFNPHPYSPRTSTIQLEREGRAERWQRRVVWGVTDRVWHTARKGSKEGEVQRTRCHELDGCSSWVVDGD